jgi:hypothetical protein
MNQNRKIQSLKSEGLSSELLSTLNETQISSLYNRLLESKKKEFEEQTQTGVTTKVTTEKITTVTPTALNSPQGVNIDGINLKNQGGQLVAKELGETSEMSEKFESKAQQGLFWAKCNNSKGQEKKKWCDMAKEFSEKTSKKDYKKMPEKLHPEKTVKVKKEQKEGFMDMVGKGLTKANLMNLDKASPSVKWESQLEKRISQIVEKHLNPKMTKGELLKFVKEQKTKESPTTKPKESPMVQPSRRNKPFLPERESQPDPKAEE